MGALVLVWCDETVRQLAREVWGDTPASPSGEHTLGKGRVLWGKGLDEVLAVLGSKPDFVSPAKLRFKHRRQGDTEIYFVANPDAAPVTTVAAFRADGRMPELWWPDSGRIERPAAFEAVDGVVRVPLSLGPNASVFVVFRASQTGAEHQARSAASGQGAFEKTATTYSAFGFRHAHLPYSFDFALRSICRMRDAFCPRCAVL